MATWTIIKLLLALLPFVVGFIGIGVNSYVARRDFDVILKTFEKSWIVVSYVNLWGDGLFSRSTISMMVAGTVVWPNRHLREGTLYPEELARLPRSVRLRMKWSVALVCGGGMGIFVGLFIIKMIRWLS